MHALCVCCWCAATVAADTAILQPSAANDEKEAHPLPDQAQLLDLVQTLIADHRYSLLERQRLQQQLEATQQALQVVKLDKDKAIVLADLRYGWRLQKQHHTQAPMSHSHFKLR